MTLSNRSLRVALVHSFYSSHQPSGENAEVQAEHEALRKAGVDAQLFAARTDDLDKEHLYRVGSMLRVASRRGRSPLSELADFAPHVVHVHNLFPNFGRTWVAEIDVPVAVTVHNFRAVCATGTLFRDGHICTDCVEGSRRSALRYRCYRGSFAATLPVVIGQRGGPSRDPALARADRILCLSGRHRDVLQQAGIDPARLTDWTNFLPRSLTPEHGAVRIDHGRKHRAGMLFVGRLRAEKGCLEMLEAWPRAARLTIVGDGPQRGDVARAAAGKNVEIINHLPRTQVLDLMQSSEALMMPSGCPEGSPLVLLEALACGLPVVVRRECDVAGLVDEHRIGSVVDAVDRMAEAGSHLGADRSIARRCRLIFDTLFAEEAWVERSIGLYESLRRAACR